MAKIAGRKKIVLFIILIITSAILLGFFLSKVRMPKSGDIQVYFLKDEALAPVSRKPLKKVSPLIILAQSLNKGPSEEEKAEGYYTGLPKGAVILSVNKKGNMAIVDFNSKLENYGGGATRIQAVIGQIVYSFTEIPNIDEVKITVDGKDEIILGGEGYVIDKPLSRSDISL